MNKELKKEFKEKFGQYAILGKAGRFYNGAFDPSVRIKDVVEFIEKALKENTEQVIKAMRVEERSMLEAEYQRGYKQAEADEVFKEEENL